MRRQNDQTLQTWAQQIQHRLAQERWHTANLIYHGRPGSQAPSSAHADNENNQHVLDMEDVTLDDLTRLQEFLYAAGVAQGVVKQASAAGGRTAGGGP
jgi:hypothetical protein